MDSCLVRYKKVRLNFVNDKLKTIRCKWYGRNNTR